MLRVYFGHRTDEIYNTEVYYQNQYDRDWVMDPFAKKIIADIDDSEVIGPDAIKNDIFGVFSSCELSAGVKTLLLMKNQPKKVFNISNCGDNCAKYILELADDRDITVCLHHYMDFGDSFQIRVINDGKRKVISKPEELLFIAHEYLRKELQV
ncbi:MAG: DUF4869 domain-containing protein [Parasporobacterium sp.]|nr:DUF4869 domain-containing protein [Parasporobacterium sp.]